MLKNFLKLFKETKPSKNVAPGKMVAGPTSNPGVFEDGKLYVNRRQEGYVNGRHFTEYVENVRKLKSAGRLDEAEVLLLKLVGATEAESKAGVGGVAPWYYEQLAIIYRKRNDLESEVSILKRYERQEKAPGVKPGVLAGRLIKAENLLKKHKKMKDQA